jgi:hypothetical protein
VGPRGLEIGDSYIKDYLKAGMASVEVIVDLSKTLQTLNILNFLIHGVIYSAKRGIDVTTLTRQDPRQNQNESNKS